MKKDKKLLGTKHTTHSIDQYFHVRKKDNDKTEFYFELKRLTQSGSKTYIIPETQLPRDIKSK